MKRAIAAMAFTALVANSSGLSAAEFQTLDRYQVEQTVNQAFLGQDTAEANGTLFASAFTSEAVFIDLDGKTYRGQDALAMFAIFDTASGQELPKGPTNPVHYVANQVISTTSYGAVSDVDVLIAQNKKSADGGVNGGFASGAITAIVHCRDELIKTAIGWKIRKRTMTYM